MVIRATDLAPSDAHSTVVEFKLLQRVAGGALEQPLDGLHPIGAEGVVAEVQDAQSGPGRHHSIAQSVLGPTGREGRHLYYTA